MAERSSVHGILTADRAEKSSVPEELAADMAERSSVHGILTADRAEKSSVPEELAADMAERSSVHGILTADRAEKSSVPGKIIDNNFASWLLNIFDGLFLNEGVLYCYPLGGVGKDNGIPRTAKLVLPGVLVDSAIKLAHDHLLIGGHMSMEKTLDRVSRTFIFERMNTKVRRYCENCNLCLRRNKMHQNIKTYVRK